MGSSGSCKPETKALADDLGRNVCGKLTNALPAGRGRSECYPATEKFPGVVPNVADITSAPRPGLSAFRDDPVAIALRRPRRMVDPPEIEQPASRSHEN